MSMDAEGNVMPKTPAAAILAATTYLRTTQPPENDPRAEVHRQTILGLGMAGDALKPVAAPNAVATTAQRQPARSPRRRGDSPRHRSRGLTTIASNHAMHAAPSRRAKSTGHAQGARPAS